MLIQFQKVKYLIVYYPHSLLFTLCFLYLLPSLTIFFIPDDVRFAVFYNNYDAYSVHLLEKL